jgi:hypothetical protein
MASSKLDVWFGDEMTIDISFPMYLSLVYRVAHALKAARTPESIHGALCVVVSLVLVVCIQCGGFWRLWFRRIVPKKFPANS